MLIFLLTLPQLHDLHYSGMTALPLVFSYTLVQSCGCHGKIDSNFLKGHHRGASYWVSSPSTFMIQKFWEPLRALEIG